MWQYDPLAFESSVFGAPVGRVARKLDGMKLDAMVGDWKVARQWLVSARVDASDTTACDELSSAGFECIETLVTLEASLPATLDMPDNVIVAGGEERQACLDIARTTFSFDRFHADLRVSNTLADCLKETWVRNSLDGRADVVLSALDRGLAVGFVTCLSSDDAGVIDLIAVAPGHQGRGIGKRLVQAAKAYYAGRRALMRVGTQEANSASLALYQSQGFIRVRTQYTYHWINEEAAP